MRPSLAVFAAAMIGLGIGTLAYGNASMIWEPIPKDFPGRAPIIHLCGVILVVTGFGLLFRRTITLASRVLVTFLLLWLVLLKLPGLILHPLEMVRWETLGETLAISAGALAIGERRVRLARWLLTAALPMFGLAHFAYADFTASLVPKWMQFPLFWTYFTGAASIAAAAGMSFRVYPRLAASLEAVMLWIITVLVWVPRVASVPDNQANWAEFLISCAIAAGAWCVADTYRAAHQAAGGG